MYYGLHTAVPTRLCEAKTVGLVRYPTTLAPASGTLSVTTQCADNAHSTRSSLIVTCDSSGNWGSQNPQCQCDSGYKTATVNGNLVCEGMYTKPANVLCVTCDSSSNCGGQTPQCQYHS